MQCLQEADGSLRTPFAVAVGKTAHNSTAAEVRTIKSIVRNPGYNPYSIAHDVGLLVLSAPVAARPAALPPATLLVPPGTLLHVAGFGLDENQQLPARLM